MNRKLRNGLIVGVIAAVVALIVWRGMSGKQEQAETTTEVLTVQIVSPQKEEWPQSVRVSGPITPWQEVIVGSETGGLQVSAVLVDVGASVRQGQVLARLSEDSLRMELREQQAALAEATVTLQQSSSELRRARAVEDIGLSKQQVEGYVFAEQRARAALESAKARLDTTALQLRQTRIVAPDDGIVSSKSAILGNVAQAGAEMFRLVRHGRVEWRPEVDGNQLAAVEPGQTAEIQLSTGDKVTGQVREAGPTLSENTGRATIYVSLPYGSAKPGMFGSGVIYFGSSPAVTVPESALVSRDGRSYLYFVDTQRKVRSQVVQTGRRQGGRVEILTEIDPSARVVERGGAFLSEDVQVRIADDAVAKAEKSQ